MDIKCPTAAWTWRTHDRQLERHISDINVNTGFIERARHPASPSGDHAISSAAKMTAYHLKNEILREEDLTNS